VAGIGLVVIDLVVFFALYQPLGSKVNLAEREHQALRQTVRNQQVRVETLKKYEDAFPLVGKGLANFTTNRTPSRREAYSTATHLVHKLAESAGVKVASIGFRLDTTQHSDPLQRLELDISLEGPYPGLLKFSHALETANDFILVREFNFAPGDNQSLGLRLGADLYLTP
jgi:Tfp pilus assembly protein PilO